MPRDDPGESRRVEFEAAALPHLEHLYGAAFYLCADRDRAADLVQETMLRGLRFFDQFEPGTNCRAWLLTILHNTFRNMYRSSRRERAQVDIDEPWTAREATDASGVDENPETLVLADMMDDEVVRALAELPDDFRAAIVLVDLEELSYAEAARALECPVGTVRSRLSRGRRHLAEKLAGYARRRGLSRSVP